MLMHSAASSLRSSSKNAISVYLQLTLVGSAAVWILIIWSGHLNMGYGLMIPAIMWCPGFAALLLSLLGRELSSEMALAAIKISCGSVLRTTGLRRRSPWRGLGVAT
jgi:hypothetical protein